MNKSKLIFTLIFNCFNALGLCVAAQLLAIRHGMAPGFSLARLGINFLVAYPVAVLVGLFFPSERFGLAVCKTLHLPEGPAFGVGMNVAINFVFTLVLSSVMTLFNVVILGHQGAGAFFGSFLGDFLPMWLCSCVVSALAQKPAATLAGLFDKKAS